MALCGLVDILFCYAYDSRVTEGEHNVESGWTLRRLSSLCSYMEAFGHVADVAAACLRRALCYPLLRHWRLACAALSDVAAILRLGREGGLRALLDCRALLQSGVECGYLLNRVWLDDYCVWLQQATAARATAARAPRATRRATQPRDHRATAV